MGIADNGAVLTPPRPVELSPLTRLHLTAREREVLDVLVARAGHVVQRQDLYRAVWGGAMQYRDRSVDVLVKRLRQKLAEAEPGIEHIHTHYGVGYRFQPQPRRHPPSPIHPSPDSPRGGPVE